jgi:hypothetical protein
MSASAATRLAWSLVALAFVMLGASIVFAALSGFQIPGDWGTGANPAVLALPGAAFPLVGAIVATRHPSNAVGWICLGCGLGIALTGLAREYALYGLEVNPGALPAATTAGWLGQWDYLLFVAPLGIYLVLLLPHGHLPSARWRPIAWIGGVAAVVAGATEGLLAGPLYQFPEVQNPYGIESAKPLIDNVGSLAFLIFVVCMIATATSMVRRLRRARGIERQQLKWFAFAASALAILFFPVVVLNTALDPNTNTEQAPLALLLLDDLATVLFAGLPIATGIAITRYRLYDIDVVINRTLVYGALTATLAGAYLGSVLLLQLILSGVTANSSLAVAGSTLAVAAMFQPARHRIQATVDRRFYRRKYDAARTLERFGTRLRDEVDLTTLGSELRGVVAEAMQPAHVSLWLRERAS